jgi:hypothetical protein
VFLYRFMANGGFFSDLGIILNQFSLLHSAAHFKSRICISCRDLVCKYTCPETKVYFYTDLRSMIELFSHLDTILDYFNILDSAVRSERGWLR